MCLTTGQRNYANANTNGAVSVCAPVWILRGAHTKLIACGLGTTTNFPFLLLFYIERLTNKLTCMPGGHHTPNTYDKVFTLNSNFRILHKANFRHLWKFVRSKWFNLKFVIWTFRKQTKKCSMLSAGRLFVLLLRMMVHALRTYV